MVPGVAAWSRDLRDFTTKMWYEPYTDVAALIVTQGGAAALWVNLALVRPDECYVVWRWGRVAAAKRPPTDVLWASQLPSRLGDDREMART